MHCPELANDLVCWDSFAVGDLLPSLGNRGFQTRAVLSVQILRVVLGRDQLKADLRAFRQIDHIVDDDAAPTNTPV